MKRLISIFPQRPPAPPEPSPADQGNAGRKNMQLLIQLRRIAVLGQVATILVVHFLLGVPLPLNAMLLLVVALAIFNAIGVLRLRAKRPVSHSELFIALLVDVFVLTAQLYYSGGATNPFVLLYLLQLTLAAMLLQTVYAWTVAGIATLCIAGLALAAPPMFLPLERGGGLDSLLVQGLLISFVLNAILIVACMTRINRNLRERDRRLAAMRQRAAEEDHIVRMGLLASGAAHELGTPLSTLAVILGDWRHDPLLTGSQDMQQEIDEMQAQVARCKSIVTGILLLAGETRGDSPTETSVHRFLEQLVEEWCASRQPKRLVYENHFGPDLEVISDSALKQMICSVLDNALEASPDWLTLNVKRDADQLVLTVLDQGPGFDADILAQLGRPYQSSKGKPGGGLGLFLSINVARTLGGSITAQNLPYGGASVTLSLPLSAIMLEDQDHDDGHA